jgi:5-methyltetrahydrofolate--homocysteine methyltransferase
MAADTFKAGMEVLALRLAGIPHAYAGTIVLGTVQGDVHDIGKNLVGFMLESSGFRVIDLGTETLPEHFVQAVQEHSPDMLAMSALLTTTMLGMPQVVEALEQVRLRDSVKIIIGGASVSQKYADDIGVDGYAATAPEGVELVRALVRG